MTTASAVNDFVPADLDASRWETLQPLYAELLAREIDSAESLEQLLLDRSELDAAASEAHALLYIRMTCHTDDEEAKSGYLTFVEQVQPELVRVSFALDRMIVGSPFAASLDADRYGILLRNARADVELFREENVPLQTEETKLGQQYSETCGAMTVMHRGTERTLPMMSKFLEETDRATREEAWRLVAERRLADRDRLDEIFDRMVGIREKIARNAGFPNYRDYMFAEKHRFDYGPKECEAYHQACEEVCVPVHRRLCEERRKALGVETLRPWDLAVDVQGRDPLRPFDGAERLVEGTAQLFERMDPAIGRLFAELRDGTSLDLESRKGKAPGGYQYNRDRIRRPFIFMNATGMQGDLSTMIHEAGHAFHALLCRDDALVAYRHPPIEFAEVASMGMELLAFPYLDEFYDEAEAARAKRGHLEALARLLPWTATVDAFQHWIYLNPKHTREERTRQWLALDERFGSTVDWTGLEAYRAAGWHRQLHIFEVPFYYIEYGIAQLGALELWLRSKKSERDAIRGYMAALALGGSKPIPALFAAAGLSFDFSPDAVKRLMDAVQREIETLPA